MSDSADAYNRVIELLTDANAPIVADVLAALSRRESPTLGSAYEWEIFLASQHLLEALRLSEEGA